MNSFIKWVGGKSKLSKIIIGLLPDHIKYVEVFAGAAWVFFRKDPSPVEVLNDRDEELINLYRIVKHHPDEFVDQFKYIFLSRNAFDRFIRTAPDLLTDTQRAVRYYYLIHVSFASKLKNYGYRIDGSGLLNHSKIAVEIKKASARLHKVDIYCKDFRDCLDEFDSESTLFYVDPPYLGKEDYPVKFTRKDHEALSEALKDLKGEFLLSYNDTEAIRDYYSGYYMREVRVFYSKAKTNRKHFPELLIANYDITITDTVSLR